MNAARNLAAFLVVPAQVLDPGRHNVLHPAASQAGHIEWLYWFIFWILFAVFVLMIAAFSRAGAKARVLASHPLPVIEKDEEGDRRAGWAVGTAIGITVITLFGILVVSVITGKRVEGLTSKIPSPSELQAISGGGRLHIQIHRRIRPSPPPMRFTSRCELQSSF